MECILQVWRAERAVEITEVLGDLELEVDEARLETLLQKEEDSIRYILKHGLDIGGIIEFIITVTLVNVSGTWMFQSENGSLYKVR